MLFLINTKRYKNLSKDEKQKLVEYVKNTE